MRLAESTKSAELERVHPLSPEKRKFDWRYCKQILEVYGLSAHYLIDEDGTVHALVPEDKRAWHAGSSHWRGITDVNSASVGIELVNPGHEFGYREFSEAQIEQALRQQELAFERHEDIEDHVARLLTEDYIVGRFNGRQEDDRRRPTALAAADELGRLETVHFGHLDVHEDQGEFLTEEVRKGLDA